MKANALCLGLLSIGSLATLATAGGCGPGARSNDSGGDTGGDQSMLVDATDPSICVPTTESCSNVLDDDCDGKTDCQDNDCSGVGNCPVCGAVDNPEVQPLALPDGISSGAACTTDAQCTSAATPNCEAKECHASYVSTLNFIGFPQGSTLTDTSKFLGVCVNMEHSWMHDLQIELISPNGTNLILHKFIDRAQPEVHIGIPYEADESGPPIPGTGWDYCWKADATNGTWHESATSGTLPAGDYKPVAPFTALAGTPLNGQWTFRVTDLWGIDNGFLFSWKIMFDPSLVADCSGPIVGKTAPGTTLGH